MIGVFDSGVGGLTVLRSIHESLAQYDTVYLGDNARSPYGTKSHEEITRFTWNGVKWLFDYGCELVILACNSASAQALSEIQRRKLAAYPGRRVLGVIRPTVEELAEHGFDHVGVLATPATVGSGAYEAELLKLDPSVRVSQKACPEWVPIVEQGIGSSEYAKSVIARDVEQFLDQAPRVQAILLGCTHYPALFESIRSVLPSQVYLYEQGPVVAKKLFNYLERHPEIESQLKKDSVHAYFTTGDPETATHAAQQIAGVSPVFKHVEIS